MHRPSREQWDALAPLWDRFEDDGLRPEHLADLGLELESPCVVIGSGLGLLCEALTTSGVARVTGVDFSPAMVERARSERGVQAVVGSAERIPFGNAELGSAVVATGVLDPRDPDALQQVWAELGRTVRSGGRVIAAFFDPAPRFRQFVLGTGILDEDGSHRTDRIVELWRSAASPGDIPARLAAWGSTSLREAQETLRRIQPFLESWFGVLDGAAEHLREAGHRDPAHHLAQCLDWGVAGLGTIEDALVGADPLLEHIGVRRFERDSVTVLSLQRR